jgi:hypothetical protein
MKEEAIMETADRVRAHTAPEINHRLDEETAQRVAKYAQSSTADITARIKELDHEWDIERVLETNASALALTGLFLGLTTQNKKWFIVPSIVLPFLFQHAVQGWCPPLPILRRLGVRSREEIDREKYALKALRGDFQERGAPGNRAQAAVAAVNA